MKNKDEKITWVVVRSIIALVAVLFVVYGVFVDQPCDIDAVFLSCRLSGSLFDIIGSGLFVGGLLAISGVFKGLDYMYNPINSSKWNLIAFAVMVIGVVLFWNL